MRKAPMIARPGPVVLGTALVMAFAGCAGPPPAGGILGDPSAATSRGVTTTSARISLDSLLPDYHRAQNRLIQTILGTAATYELTVAADNGGTPGTQVFSGTGNITGGAQNTITVDNLPANYLLDFKLIVKDSGTVEVGRGLAQATLVSQNSLNSVAMTGYAEGGDMSGMTTGQNRSVSVSYNGLNSGDSRVVAARFNLVSGTTYDMSFSETAISCSPTFSVQSGAETAVLPGTGNSNSADFSVSPGATGYHDFRATFTGCSGNPTYRIKATVQ